MKPKNWPEYFLMIEKRPPMFLGKTSLVRLEFEVQGIRVAEDMYDVPLEKRLGGFSFEKFEDWVDKTYNTNHLMVRSFSLAQYLTSKNNQEEDCVEAFTLWFTWYHEYQDKQTTVKETDLPVTQTDILK